MAESMIGGELMGTWQREAVGPATLADVMSDVDEQVAAGDTDRFRPLPLGFDPLDDVLNGGLRPGELMVVGGPFGVGKTILALQIARNVAATSESDAALYICYEHDRVHLMSRLLCLESTSITEVQDQLTLRKLADMAYSSAGQMGLISRLKRSRRYEKLLDKVSGYAHRLTLAKASGDQTGLEQIRQWAQLVSASGAQRILVVVDYLQKIPVVLEHIPPGMEHITYLANGLKEIAMMLEVRILALAAADRRGLQASRMRFYDLEGTAAIQYEADVGAVLNSKYDIVSREHMVYNPAQAQAMRNWVVLSIEKNRAGVNAVDMEFELDAAHFYLHPVGQFVRERLIDNKVILA